MKNRLILVNVVAAPLGNDARQIVLPQRIEQELNCLGMTLDCRLNVAPKMIVKCLVILLLRGFSWFRIHYLTFVYRCRSIIRTATPGMEDEKNGLISRSNLAFACRCRRDIASNPVAGTPDKPRLAIRQFLSSRTSIGLAQSQEACLRLSRVGQ